MNIFVWLLSQWCSKKTIRFFSWSDWFLAKTLFLTWWQRPILWALYFFDGHTSFPGHGLKIGNQHRLQSSYRHWLGIVHCSRRVPMVSSCTLVLSTRCNRKKWFFFYHYLPPFYCNRNLFSPFLKKYFCKEWAILQIPILETKFTHKIFY